MNSYPSAIPSYFQSPPIGDGNAASSSSLPLSSPKASVDGHGPAGATGPGIYHSPSMAATISGGTTGQHQPKPSFDSAISRPSTAETHSPGFGPPGVGGPGTPGAGAPTNLITPAIRPTERAVQLPTVTITYEGRTVKARIDKGVPLSEIIRQLCTSPTLAVRDPSPLFCLRDVSSNELITGENLGRKLEARSNFRLVSSPEIEASEIVERLRAGMNAGKAGDGDVKRALWQLKGFVREWPFTISFLARSGLRLLVAVIKSASGNTLAYALTSMQNLLELDWVAQVAAGANAMKEEGEEGLESWEGWEIDGVNEEFVEKVVEILVSKPLVNICRPATAIIRKFVSVSSSAEAIPSAFDPKFLPPPVPIYNLIRRSPSTGQPIFLKTLVQRLGQSGGDNILITSSLQLLTSLLRYAVAAGETGLENDGLGDIDDGRGDGIWDELERLDVGRAVVRLMESHSSDEVTPAIIQFQSAVISLFHHLIAIPVSPEDHIEVSLLEAVYARARLGDEIIQPDKKWKAIGFETNPWWEFDKTGVLGLKTMAKFTAGNGDDYFKGILEQINRPPDRRCPFAKACNEVTEILADLFDFNTGVSQTPMQFLPFTLSFQRVHSLALKFFFRMWAESGATSMDFARVSNLVRSQVHATFGSQNSEKTWYEVESEFQESEYRVVRDRQMRELEIEDELLSKAPVRNLRGRLYRESFEFVRAQRINCLHEGAWFLTPQNPNSTPGLDSTGSKRDARKQSIVPQRFFRFYRLAANKKHLHFVESTERLPVRGGLDDLPEKIDLSFVTDVVPNIAPTAGYGQLSTSQRGRGMSVSQRDTNLGANLMSPHHSNRLSTISASSNSSFTSTFGFQLLSSDVIVADMIALDQATYSEWIDGLSLLKDGHIVTKESADLVHVLTEIGVKMKLLDLSGEKVEIPSQLPQPQPPMNTNFYYAETP